jgi:hypothetical protein
LKTSAPAAPTAHQIAAVHAQKSKANPENKTIEYGIASQSQAQPSLVNNSERVPDR